MGATVDCAEYNRLVVQHLKTIAEWKRTFDDPHAWQETQNAEQALVEHYQEHGCREAPDAFKGTSEVV